MTNVEILPLLLRPQLNCEEIFKWQAHGWKVGPSFLRCTSVKLSPAMFTEDLSHTRDKQCARSAFQAQMMLDLCSYRVLALVGQRGALLVTPSAKACVFISKVCVCSRRSAGQPMFPEKSGQVLQHGWHLNLGSLCEWKRPRGKRARKFSRCESKNSKHIVGENGLRSQGYGRD